jgi:sodium/bile acid cotransporter 7
MAAHNRLQTATCGLFPDNPQSALCLYRLSMSRPRFLPDNFTLMLMATVALASFFPASGVPAQWLNTATTVVIVLLFFLHGAKLSRPAILAGIGHWRLHLVITAITFVAFPILGWSLRPLLEPLVTPDLYLGILFLCTVPATVQSAIALTALARGNMPAAICSASGSTLLGILFTPLLVGMLLHVSASSSDPLAAIGKIALQLLVPFVVGHLMRPWVAPIVQWMGTSIKVVDQGSILLVVYSAFSGAVVAGLWSQMPLPAMAGLFVLCALLLACSMALCVFASRRLGFSTEDEIAILFCGAQKSLVSGVPMAKVLFPASMVGSIVLPLMLFHPMQLMVSAVIAGRYARRPGAADTERH